MIARAPIRMGAIKQRIVEQVMKENSKYLGTHLDLVEDRA